MIHESLPRPYSGVFAGNIRRFASSIDTWYQVPVQPRQFKYCKARRRIVQLPSRAPDRRVETAVDRLRHVCSGHTRRLEHSRIQTFYSMRRSQTRDTCQQGETVQCCDKHGNGS